MTEGLKDELQPHRPLTKDERTERILEAHDDDMTMVCGCSFWREDSTPMDTIVAIWCERHVPLHKYDEAGVHCV